MLKAIVLAAGVLLLGRGAGAAAPADTSGWVRFSAFSYTGRSEASPADGEYLNPVIAGFYPDPSVCRVGDDYYLVNSSFQYFPGLPIWHSTDLVHWTQIGNVIDRPGQYAMRGGPVQAGLYAPTIRYCDGTYYVVCTLVGGGGNFYVTAEDPKGPWSDPVLLPQTGGIDPSLFFDDDGKCYVVNCDEPVGQPRYVGHRTIRLQELDLKQGKTVGEQTILVNGGTDIAQKPVWCEGPHLYHVDGKYYLMAAQGGTGTAHSEVIFRSDALRGPYLPWDQNPILTARDLPPDRPNPITCTGHADLVQTRAGQWFAVFLGCQPYEKGFYNTGRQTFLLPVIWQSGWPRVLPPQTPVPLTATRPDLPAGPAAPVTTTGDVRFTDHLEADTLAFRWVGLRAPASTWYAVSKQDHALLLEPRADTLSGQGNPSYLAVRQQNNTFACTVTLAATPATADCTAGLAAFQNEGHFYALSVKIAGGRLTDISVEQSAPAPANAVPTPPKTLVTDRLPDACRSVDLRIEGDGPKTRFSYRTGSDAFRPLGEAAASSFLSTDVAGGFQGVTLGVFAYRP